MNEQETIDLIKLIESSPDSLDGMTKLQQVFDDKFTDLSRLKTAYLSKSLKSTEMYKIHLGDKVLTMMEGDTKLTNAKATRLAERELKDERMEALQDEVINAKLTEIFFYWKGRGKIL